MSSDSASASLPYAVIVKMVALPGRKRLGMNEIMKSQGVKEATIPSILRGSLVMYELPGSLILLRPSRCPGIPFYAARRHHDGHRRPVQFLRCSHQEKIEDHDNAGGDGGLTRATMRSACRLPVQALRHCTPSAECAAAPASAAAVAVVPLREHSVEEVDPVEARRLPAF